MYSRNSLSIVNGNILIEFSRAPRYNDDVPRPSSQALGGGSERIGFGFRFQEMNFAGRSAFMLTFAGHVELANPFPCSRVTCPSAAVVADRLEKG